MDIYSIGSLAILAMNTWAFVAILSSDATAGAKLVWALIVLVLPVIGFIVWLFAGPRQKPVQ